MARSIGESTNNRCSILYYTICFMGEGGGGKNSNADLCCCLFSFFLTVFVVVVWVIAKHIDICRDVNSVCTVGFLNSWSL